MELFGFLPLMRSQDFVFDASRIGGVKFWHDRHRAEGPYITDEVHERLQKEDITGIKYYYYEQA